MSIGKLLKKVFLYSLLVLIAVLVASSALIYFYRDTIIQKFVSEVNKNINTPILVDKITISSLENFPNVSIDLNKVKINGSLKNKKGYLLEADKIRFLLNPFEIFKGNYTIEGLTIRKAVCQLQIDVLGNTNFDILKKQASDTNSKFKFALSDIKLFDIHFIYDNLKNKNYIDLTSKKTSARLISSNNIYDIKSEGEYFVKNLSIKNQYWIKNKNISASTVLSYNDQKKSLIISPSDLIIESAEFLAYGDYIFDDSQSIDIHLEGKNSSIATISALLPEKIQERIAPYESKGEVYFDLILNGALDKKTGPKLEIQFGLSNADLTHPESGTTLQNTNTEGYFLLKDIYNLQTASLELKNINGVLENRSFKGNFEILDFKSPKLNFDFEGLMDLESILRFYKPKNLSSASGLLNIEMSFNGKIADLKSKTLSNKIKTSGQISLQNVHLSIDQANIPLTNLNGMLLFNNNDLAIDQVNGKYGNSDFLLNGFFKNILAFIFLDNEPIGIEADLYSEFIDLDQLLSSGTTNNDSEYELSISPRIRLKFDCKIKYLAFRRFKPRNLTGDLIIKNQIMQTNNISFNSMGGRVILSGIADVQKSESIDLGVDFSLSNLNIDSIFYVFENFNQDFIKEKHLSGKVVANIKSRMSFDQYLNLNQNSLESTISTTISNGALNNFEPMQQLSKYVENDKLEHLKFADLKNEIFIKDKTIYLPQMEVGSNVTSLKISGTHTFDQHINYKVITPLRNRKKMDRDEAFGAIESDGNGQTLLFLKIIGTTNDYKVVYDKEEVRKKIITDLKKEAQEFKDAFKNKNETSKKEIELKEDDYFDWEENDK